MQAVRRGLLVGGGFAFAFLAGQLVVWRELVDLGYYLESNPAAAFFYLLTGLHGLHLLGGLVAWGKTTAKAWSGAKVSDVAMAVELCTPKSSSAKTSLVFGHSTVVELRTVM